MKQISSPSYLQILTLLTIIFFTSLLQAQTIITFDAGNVCGVCETLPMSINDKGDVTGTYSDLNGLAHGFLRMKNGSVTLFEVLSPDLGTLPQAAWASHKVAWRIVAFGGSLNMLVCSRNHWLMPALAKSSMSDGRHVQLCNQSHLVLLADIIGKPDSACSIGDLFVLTGVLIIIGFWFRDKLKRSQSFTVEKVHD
jgi:hypothetical protein